MAVTFAALCQSLIKSLIGALRRFLSLFAALHLLGLIEWLIGAILPYPTL